MTDLLDLSAVKRPSAHLAFVFFLPFSTFALVLKLQLQTVTIVFTGDEHLMVPLLHFLFFFPAEIPAGLAFQSAQLFLLDSLFSSFRFRIFFLFVTRFSFLSFPCCLRFDPPRVT